MRTLLCSAILLTTVGCATRPMVPPGPSAVGVSATLLSLPPDAMPLLHHAVFRMVSDERGAVRIEQIGTAMDMGVTREAVHQDLQAWLFPSCELPVALYAAASRR